MEQLDLTSAKRKRGEHDTQVIYERLRREKAADYYTVLQSLVPTLFPKATRSKIVEETIRYIKHLEGKLEFLKQQQRVEPAQPIQLTQRNRTSTVDLAVSGNMTLFAMSFTSRPGLLCRVLQVFETHFADVLTATIVLASDISWITVTAWEVGASVDRIKRDLMAI
ncbi:Transcription factor bHLH95 [Rhynchospora pubera]|nr:Transcription factor bHLH95 [Rhynchospora pubera]KAJ4777725.1 Transcription factor bHLH95 [Rhynchospora pubera]